MSTATFTFKCGVIGADGQVDPNGYKFLTWNYVIKEDENNKMYNIFRKSCHNSLAQRVLSVYPHLADEATKIIYIDEKNDTIVIPCGDVHETVHVLKVINEGDLEEQRSPIRIFIQIVPPPAQAVTPVASYPVLRDLHCSICKKELNTKFVYQCLQCENDFTLCENCETAGKHPEHVVIRFVGEQQPNCLPEIKQLVSSTTTHLAVETLKIE